MAIVRKISVVQDKTLLLEEMRDADKLGAQHVLVREQHCPLVNFLQTMKFSQRPSAISNSQGLESDVSFRSNTNIKFNVIANRSLNLFAFFQTYVSGFCQ